MARCVFAFIVLSLKKLQRMSPAISIPCPNCQTPIPVDNRQLVLGVQFTCSKCQSVIGLSQESNSIVKNTMEKFEHLKNNIREKGK